MSARARDYLNSPRSSLFLVGVINCSKVLAHRPFAHLNFSRLCSHNKQLRTALGQEARRPQPPFQRPWGAQQHQGTVKVRGGLCKVRAGRRCHAADEKEQPEGASHLDGRSRLTQWCPQLCAHAAHTWPGTHVPWRPSQLAARRKGAGQGPCLPRVASALASKMLPDFQAVQECTGFSRDKLRVVCKEDWASQGGIAG